MKAVDLPISIDSANPEAIQAALSVYKGKAIVNSVTGEEARRRGIEIAQEILLKIQSMVQGVYLMPPFGRIETALEVVGIL